MTHPEEATQPRSTSGFAVKPQATDPNGRPIALRSTTNTPALSGPS